MSRYLPHFDFESYCVGKQPRQTVVAAHAFIPIPTVAVALGNPNVEILPEFHIITQRTIYKANTLHGVLTLWRQAHDPDEVVEIRTIGG